MYYDGRSGPSPYQDRRAALIMRVLVTGLCGFTGKYAEEALRARGLDVQGLNADLRDADAVRKEVAELRPNAVLHLAAIAFVGSEDVDAFYTVNLLGTRNLLSALSALPPLQSVILASSANVYGNTAAGKIQESHPPNPANDYAVSKLAMEYMARTWASKLPISIVRPFNYTGVGQSENFLIPKIVGHFQSRAPVISLGNTDVARDFGDVRTVIEVYARLLEQGIVGETVNVCTGRSVTLTEVISLCQKITGHQIKVEINPAFVRENEVKHLSGDNSLLTRLIGEVRYPTFESTLRWMLDAE